MTSLEQIVLPLEQSRALVEKGIVLDTAMVWVWSQRYNPKDTGPIVVTRGEYEQDQLPPIEDDGLRFLCPAPVLSELLDAIRDKVGGAETTAILSHDKSEAGASCAGIRTEGGKYEIAQALTDLLAAAALLLEVSK